jgi:CRP-like cAMP-binding protein
MASNKEIMGWLEGIGLFSRCAKSDLRIIARHAETITAESGRTIVREGDDGDALFVLLGGTASVERGGKQVATLGPGDYFGELALLDPAPRAATVTATDDVEMAVLGVRMFRVLLRELPPLGAKLLGDLAARVRVAGAPDLA